MSMLAERASGPVQDNPHWPLVARAEELRFIASAVRRGGRPGGVVLAGAAGVGKTRLAREALGATVRRGVTPWWVAASASARVVPLGAFASLAPGLVGSRATPEALREVVVALLAEGAERGIALGVDDAHLLDDFSAAMVHQLAVRAEVPLIVTLRTGEPAPDAITALWKDGHLDRLELQPFSPEDTAELVEAVLGGPVESHSARRLYSATKGNALFLRHVVSGALHSGGLRQTAGVWQWHGHAAVSPQLAELVDAQMGAVPKPVRDVLEALAFGEPLDVSALSRLADPLAVEEADRRALIRIEEEGGRLEARLAHPVYGEVVRGATGVLAARRWRGRIARSLAGDRAGRPQDVLRRAVLALDSDTPPDFAVLSDAARIAAVLLDVKLAERLSRAARDVGGGFESALALGYALTWQGRWEEAEDEFAALCAVADTDDRRVRSTIARAGNLFWGLCRIRDAEAMLEEAELLLDEPACRTELTAFRAAVEQARGNSVVAAELSAGVLAEPEARDGAVFWAALAATGALGLLGRADEIGDAPIRGMIAASGSFERAWLRCGLAAMEIGALRGAGHLSRAGDRVAELRRDAGVQGPLANSVCVYLAGGVALDSGQAATAVRTLREALASFTMHDPGGGWTVRCRLALAQAHALAGDVADAYVVLSQVDDEDTNGVRFLRPQVALSRACVAAAEGSVTHAVALARRAAEEAAACGQLATEVGALHIAVRFGDRTAADRLAGLAEHVDGPLAPVASEHARAVRDDDGPALLAVADRLSLLGAVLAAAEAAAQAACAFGRHGKRAEALAASARAQRLASACEGARTPALAAVEQPLPLTTREREIANLVAAGLSNKQIAERLVVSVRTVEGHVYHACTKLDVPDRAGLATVLGNR